MVPSRNGWVATGGCNNKKFFSSVMSDVNIISILWEGFGYPITKNHSQKPSVYNQNDSFMQFSCHKSQRMVVMDKLFVCLSSVTSDVNIIPLVW